MQEPEQRTALLQSESFCDKKEEIVIGPFFGSGAMAQSWPLRRKLKKTKSESELFFSSELATPYPG